MERIRQSGRIGMLQGELLIQRTIDYLVGKVKPVAVDLPVAPTEAEQEAAADAAAAGEDQGEAGQEDGD